MGAGTLPIPKDTVYDFQGSHLGNEFTCSLQGFLIFYGSFLTFWYNACIAVYYMCTITFKMSPTKKEKYIKPVMHTVCQLATLPTAILFWVHKWLNPSPFEPFCIAISYPYYCKSELEDADQCSIRGKPTRFQIENRTNLVLFYVGFMMIIPLTILFSTDTIIVSVCREEGAMHTKTNTTLESLSRINMTEGRMVQRRRQRHEYTKRIAIHAFFYVVAGLLPQIAGRFLASRESNEYSRRSQILYTLLRPCQGLLNFIGFLGKKCPMCVRSIHR